MEYEDLPLWGELLSTVQHTSTTVDLRQWKENLERIMNTEGLSYDQYERARQSLQLLSARKG